MTTLFIRHTGIAALAAVVIVGLGGLTLDRSYADSLPKGVIEVGNPETLAVGDTLIASLPAVEVIGAREVNLAGATAHDAPQG
jgi:hypothetical protein